MNWKFYKGHFTIVYILALLCKLSIFFHIFITFYLICLKNAIYRSISRKYVWKQIALKFEIFSIALPELVKASDTGGAQIHLSDKSRRQQKRAADLFLNRSAAPARHAPHTNPDST